MREALLVRLIFTLTFGPLIGMIAGCGEELAEDTATILKTDPDDGGRMFAENDLVITFDRTVAAVKINGIAADVDNTYAYWPGTGLENGKQDLTIEWTDENGGVNSEDITLTIQELDLVTCSGDADCVGPDCEFP